MAANVASFRVPVPWERSSPSFDGKTASSMKRFVRHCRMIVDQAGITNVVDQKNQFTDYLSDDDVREQMESLPSWAAGTLDEWIADMEALYPEIQEFGEGSLEELRKICSDHYGLDQSQVGAVKRYGMAFSNEANKLSKPPALVSNRELVELYLSVFSLSFIENIKTMMLQVSFWNHGNTAGGVHPMLIGAPAVPQAAAAVVPPVPGVAANVVGQGNQPPVVGVVGAGAANPLNPLLQPVQPGVPVAGLINRREDTLPLVHIIWITESISKTWSTLVPLMSMAPRVKTTEVVTTRENFVPKQKEEVSHKLETFANELAQIKDSSVLQEKRYLEVRKWTAYSGVPRI